jgi:hypothetical protein
MFCFSSSMRFISPNSTGILQWNLLSLHIYKSLHEDKMMSHKKLAMRVLCSRFVLDTHCKLQTSGLFMTRCERNVILNQ